MAARAPHGGAREASLAAAARWLQRSWPVVVPSETVYGLAARAVDRRAVQRVFEVKGRPADNPLIVHIAGEPGSPDLKELGIGLSGLAEDLAARFWPGPLTLVVPFVGSLPWVTAGLDSIALRAPTHPFFRALIERTGPLAAPSANRSGRPSPSLAQHAIEDLGGRVPLVVDDGLVEHGLESTVVDTRGGQLRVLRLGALPLEALAAAAAAHRGVSLGRAETPEAAGPPRSPGMKYRHYSPRAQLWLYAPGARGCQELVSDAEALRAQGSVVGAVAASCPAAAHTKAPPGDAAELARQLFRMLRELDALGVDHILIQEPRAEGIGRAVIDRLRRAATRVRRGGACSAARGGRVEGPALAPAKESVGR